MAPMATDKRTRQKQARRQKIEAQRKSAARRRAVRRGVYAAVIAVVFVLSSIWIIVGNSSKSTSTSTTTTSGVTTTTSNTAASAQAAADKLAVAAGCPPSTSTRVNTLSWSSAPAMAINTAKTYTANFVTTAGDFTVALDAAKAPVTVNNFVFLARHDYYHCVIFHRVIPGFMIQTGDPTGTGTGGPGYTIADEYPATASPQYPLFSVAVANTGKAHSGGSQFFIVSGATGETLSPTYSLFGQVTSGTSTVKTIEQYGDQNANSDGTGTALTVTERILSVTISES